MVFESLLATTAILVSISQVIEKGRFIILQVLFLSVLVDLSHRVARLVEEESVDLGAGLFLTDRPLRFRRLFDVLSYRNLQVLSVATRFVYEHYLLTHAIVLRLPIEGLRAVFQLQRAFSQSS